MGKTKTVFCLIMAFMLPWVSGFAQTETPGKDEAIYQAKVGIETFQQWYNKDTGIWKNWWNSANGLTTIILFSKYTKSDLYFPVIANTFEKAKTQNFLNDYYDDEGWWAIAWLDAYELTKNPDYLRMSEFIFKDMTTGWTDEFNGGVFWKKDVKYKNAITNGLFIILGYRFSEILPETKVNGLTYLEWANKTWAWYEKSGIINTESYFIEDGLEKDGKPNRNQHWTYNQGIAIAVALNVYKHTKDEKYMTLAKELAKTTMTKMVHEDGVLRERNEPRMGDDGAQFKGIFMRHFYLLYAATKDPAYRDFILKNANAIWKNKNTDNQFGGVWNQPCKETDAIIHSSALDAIVSAAAVLILDEKENK